VLLVKEKFVLFRVYICILFTPFYVMLVLLMNTCFKVVSQVYVFMRVMLCLGTLVYEDFCLKTPFLVILDCQSSLRE
jgi:hypothetical protein